MSAPVLLIRSHHPEPGFDPVSRSGERGDFAVDLERGTLRAVWDWELTADDLIQASGIITTIHLDQIRMMAFAPAIAAFLAKGGRWVLNGHVMRPLAPGLETFRPVKSKGRTAFALTRLAEYAVFDGVDRDAFQTMRGVAGFYGRGCNPLPDGATALTGVGPDRLPVDWIWRRRDGGEILSHAGNDWWATSTDKAGMTRFAANLVSWASGGAAA